MNRQPVTENSPGSALFPEYATLYSLIASNVEDLSDEQLDFEEITHRYNIQRLRRAQGLPTVSDLPRVGY